MNSIHGPKFKPTFYLYFSTAAIVLVLGLPLAEAIVWLAKPGHALPVLSPEFWKIYLTAIFAGLPLLCAVIYVLLKFEFIPLEDEKRPQ